MAQDFGSLVNKWVAETKTRMNMVFRQSVTDVVTYMQTPVTDGGNMPVLYGTLRASLKGTSSIGGVAPVARSGSRTNLDGVLNLGLDTLTPGKSISFFYTAAHAMRLNYGFHGVDSMGRHYDQKGYLFVEKAAQRWPTIVRKNAAAAKKAGT